MAVEFGKGIRVASSFDLDVKVPLDSRITVTTIADRDAHVTENRAYEGMLVYVEANKTLYQYVDSSWKPLLGDLDDRLNAVESQLGLGEGFSISGRVDSLEQKVGAPASDENEASGLFSNISSLETKDTELKSEIDIISDALSNEIDRATTAEEANKAAINKEILDRQNAISDHGTHVTYESNVPQANGTASAGTSTSVSRGDHVHPLQTEVSGNAGTATKLQTPVNINSVAFDGSKDITIEDNTKVKPTGTIVANHVAVFDDTTGKIIKDSGFTIAKSVPDDAKFTDTTYEEVTTSKSGLMSATDKSKLDGIAEGANNYIHPTKHEASMIIEDNTHRFITDKEKNKWNNKSDFDGNYNNLTNKPSIPTKMSELENDNDFTTNSYVNEMLGGKRLVYLTQAEYDILTEEEKNNENVVYSITDIDIDYATKDELHYHDNKVVLDEITEAKVTSWNNKSDFSGNYNDLTNKPSIPAKTSELENDSVFVTNTELDSKGYLTEHQDISGKVDKVEGKSLISDTEIERLANVTNYDDTKIKEELNNKANLSDLHQHDNKTVLDGITANKVTSWDNKSDFSGNYNDLTYKPTIPSKTSELVNDSNYVTENKISEIKEELNNKADISDLHQHTNKEVLDEITTEKVTSWDNKSDFSGDYNDLANKPNIPTQTSQLINNSGFLTSIPSEYITETELEAKGYLTEHQSLSEYATKDDLHYHDNKTVLDGITTEKVTSWDNKSDFSGSYNDLTDKPSIPTKTSELVNDSNFATKTDLNSKVDKVEGKSLISDTEIERLANVTNYDDTKIKEELNNKADISDLHQHDNKMVLDGITEAKVTSWDNKSDFSGSYNDLTNKPNIPTKTSQLTNDSSFLTSVPSEYITETELDAKGYLTEHQSLSNYATKDELHSHDNKKVLDGITTEKVTSWDNKSDFDGNYNNLTNKPNIPTKMSELENDSDFTTNSYVNEMLGGKRLVYLTQAEYDILTEEEKNNENVVYSITDINIDYVTEEELNNKEYATQIYVSTKIAEAQLSGGEADLSAYATKDDLKTKIDYEIDIGSGIELPITFDGSYNSLTDKPEIPSLEGYATETYVANAIAEAQLSGGEADLNNYATKDELHNHNNKAVLDNITEAKITSWDNKSNFSGNYNDLTNKPNIPSLDGYATIEDLKSKDLKEGMIVRTLGYYDLNDGGCAEYYIKVKDGTEDTLLNIPLNDGIHVAMLLLNSNKLNVKTVGVRYGSSNYKIANSEIIQNIIKKYNSDYILYFPKGDIWVSNIHFLDAPSNFSPHIRICGEGINDTKINTDGDDLFYDKRTDSTNFYLEAKDITMQTKSFVVTGWIPKGICFGMIKNNNNSETNFRFTNVNIVGFEYGVYAPNYACGGSGGDNVTFYMCKYGIYINDASHCFNITNVSCNYCANGINLGVGGEGNLIRNFHSATGYLGEDKDKIEHFVSIYTRGNLTIDGLYYEPYESSASTNKHIMIDYEPYPQEWGGRPLTLRNCNIGYPGAGNTGLFMRVGCYLGASYGRPNESGEYTYLKPMDGHYWDGIINWEESTSIGISSFKKLIEFKNKEDGKLLYLGNSIKGNCIPEIYDEDYILNKKNTLYISTNPSLSYSSPSGIIKFAYNSLSEYCPLHSANKDSVSQTNASIIQNSNTTKKIEVSGYVEISELSSNNGNTEFDIKLCSGDYSWFIGHFKNEIGGSKKVFPFYITIPQHEITNKNIREELVIAFEYADDKKYDGSIDYQNVYFNYTHSIIIN